MKVLDLFSGLGGFSEAFLRAGDEVVRVENNPLLSEVPNTSIECVRQVRDRLLEYKQKVMRSVTSMLFLHRLHVTSSV